MGISVIIPHWSFNSEIDETLRKCVDSLSGYDELIIVTNEGTGFAKAVNQGLKVARGEYLMVVNNDIMWTHGGLQSLCVPGVVTSPSVNHIPQKFWGSFFCIPRSVYEKIGGLDEQFEIGYYEDDDYVKRLDEAGIEMRAVQCNVNTPGQSTMSQFDIKDLMARNKAKFNKKWNIE